MKIFIKKLNCQGTNRIVLNELKKMGLAYSSYETGKIDLVRVPSPDQWIDLKNRLLKYGLQVSTHENSFVIQIRQAVNEVIEKRNIPGNNLRLYLSGRFRNNYDYLNNFFLNETGFSIEELFLENSIENRKRRRSGIEKYRHLFKLVWELQISEYNDPHYPSES